MAGVQMAPRNEAFAAKLALTYAELYDGKTPSRARVSLRISDGLLELKNVQTQAITRWRLSNMREVPDTSDENALTFAADNYDPARLVVREVEAIRALAQTGEEFKPLTGPRGQMIRLGIVAVAASLGIWGLLFGLIPWFAERAAGRIPANVEVALGEQVFHGVYTASGASECLDPAGLAAVAAMEARLTRGTDIHVPLSIRVVREPSINATALPGGHVTIHDGLLQNAQGPDEVAAVLAHEIGHVVNRDGTREYFRRISSYGVIGIVFGDVFGLGGAQIANGLVSASYSREAETEADRFAHEMMVEANLPPEAMVSFFGRLQAELGDRADQGVLRHLSSHPQIAERIEAAAAVSAATTTSGPPVLTEAEWAAMQAMCSASGDLDGDKATDES